MAYKLSISIEKIAAGAALVGCVVLALRTARLIGAGVYLVGRTMRSRKNA